MKLRILVLFLVITNALAQTGTVVGRIVDDEEGYPVMGCVVQLASTGAHDVIDVDGRYRFDNVKSGTDSLTLKALGYHTLVCPVTVKPNVVTVANYFMSVVIMFDSHPGDMCGTPDAARPLPDNYLATHSKVEYCAKLGTLAVSVKEESSRTPLVGATISLLDLAFPRQIAYPARAMKSDAGGDCIFDDLLPGRYRVRINMRGCEPQAKELLVKESKKRYLNVRLKRSR